MRERENRVLTADATHRKVTMSLHESPFDRDQDSVTRRFPGSRENFSRRPVEGAPSTDESDRDSGESEESSPGDATGTTAPGPSDTVPELTSADRATAPSPLSSSRSDEESFAAARLSVERTSVERNAPSRVTTPDHEMLSRLGRPRSSDGSSVSTGSLAEFAFRGGRRSDESDDAPARDPACDQPSGYLARPR